MKKLLVLLSLLTFTCIAQTSRKNPAIVINDPWIRPAASGANTGLFFEIVNKTDKPDTLIGAKSNLASLVELHETYQKSEGVMGMRAIKSVAVPPNSSVKFKPRDLHIMLLELKKDMKIGSSGEIKLRFKYAGIIRIKATVRDMPKIQ